MEWDYFYENPSPTAFTISAANCTAEAEWSLASTNCSDIRAEVEEYGVSTTSIIIGLILALIILATIMGNVFVLVAIWMERSLHSSVANYLILSLAVADLMVACLVMPLGAYKEVSQKWELGATMCDMWTTSDVLSCTASILHLVAIAFDRYWAVTWIDYIHHRTATRISTMIGVIWAVSILVSLSPVLFGWKDPDWYSRLENGNCLVSQSLGYQIFGTLASFYVPLAVILVLYYRIYDTATKRIRRRSTKPDIQTITAPNYSSPEKSALLNFRNLSGAPTPESTPPSQQRVVRPPRRNTRRETMESKRENRAAKTLAIITGAIISCWLPFFVLALHDAICLSSNCKYKLHGIVAPILLWLGYFNSTINPIIYTIFSPEFRLAFKKILFGRHYIHNEHSSPHAPVHV